MFACRVVELHRFLCAHDRTGRVLADQVLRSGTAVGANLEEGRSGQSRADFIGKYSIALKEARETHYWLRLLTSGDLAPPNLITPLIVQANERVAIVTALVKKAKSAR